MSFISSLAGWRDDLRDSSSQSRRTFAEAFVWRSHREDYEVVIFAQEIVFPDGVSLLFWPFFIKNNAKVPKFTQILLASTICYIHHNSLWVFNAFKILIMIYNGKRKATTGLKKPHI